MSGPDAFPDEMSGLSSFPGRSGGGYDEPLLDMVFDRRPLPPGAPPEMHDLARFLAAAAGAAEPGELAGEAAALAVFGQAASPAGVWSAGRGGEPAGRRRRRRRSQSPWPAGRRRSPSWRPASGWARLAVALVTSAIVLGSTAAYIGVLPSRVQQMAHVTLGAPAPAQGPDRRGDPPAKAPRPPRVKRPALEPARQPRPEPARTATATRPAGQVKAVSSPRDRLRSGRASGFCTPSPPPAPLAPVWKPEASALATPQVTPCSFAAAAATPAPAAVTRAPSRSARREGRR
jgi:hypothetical protein